MLPLCTHHQVQAILPRQDSDTVKHVSICTVCMYVHMCIRMSSNCFGIKEYIYVCIYVYTHLCTYVIDNLYCIYSSTYLYVCMHKRMYLCTVSVP